VIAGNVHVLGRFVGDRIGTGGGATLDALEPGDGAVDRVDHRTVAAFRDDDGTVRGVAAACTQLGCLVTFNPPSGAGTARATARGSRPTAP